MRKFLIIVLTILILVLAFFFIRDGFQIGSAKILGVYEIDALSESLDHKLNQAENLTMQQFPSEYDSLNESLENLSTERQKYETVLAQSSESDIAEALKKEKYEIEKLWISIGNYADEHNVKVNMQITASSSGIAEVKDLNFTVNGSYVGITEFIYDLEDDQELEFKIEKFKLVPDTTNSNLKATFVVKDVNVNISTVKAPIANTLNENDNTNGTNTVETET